MPDKNMQRRSFFQYLVGIPAAVTALVAVADVPVVAKPLVAEPPKQIPIDPAKVIEHYLTPRERERIIHDAFRYCGLIDFQLSSEDYRFGESMLEATVVEWRLENLPITPDHMVTAVANKICPYYGIPRLPSSWSQEQIQKHHLRRISDRSAWGPYAT